jgi:23S rRNA (cytidine1920-2'-O)/16S rRNA (cytidine1409-2'-O)-methyltransferase
VSMDASFISLRLLFPAVRRWLEGEGGEVIALVKPQFEAGRKAVGRGGVVRDPLVHQSVMEGVMASAVAEGLNPRGGLRSPLLGPKGNQEFLLWCTTQPSPIAPAALLEALFES